MRYRSVLWPPLAVDAPDMNLIAARGSDLRHARINTYTCTQCIQIEAHAIATLDPDLPRTRSTETLCLFVERRSEHRSNRRASTRVTARDGDPEESFLKTIRVL